MNYVVLSGNITNDLDLKKTQNGKDYLNFTIAVNSYSKDKEKKTQFIDCVAWETRADLINQFCQKGDKLYIEGELQTSNYEKQDGSKVKQTRVIVSKLEFAPKQKSDKSEGKKLENTEDNFANTPSIQVTSDDLPFY